MADDKKKSWFQRAAERGEALDRKIAARTGRRPWRQRRRVSTGEALLQATVLGALNAADPELRVRIMEAVDAVYCKHCGHEQPDDPDENCRCQDLN